MSVIFNNFITIIPSILDNDNKLSNIIVYYLFFTNDDICIPSGRL